MAIVLVTAALLELPTHIYNHGTVKAVGVGIYWDIACTQNVTDIDWGLCSPGTIHYRTVFCKNIQTVPITMTLNISDWNPANSSSFLFSTWNYTTAILTPDTTIPVQFSLQIYANVTAIKNFSFVYTVTAVEV